LAIFKAPIPSTSTASVPSRTENQSDNRKKGAYYADQDERCENMPSAAIRMPIRFQTEGFRVPLGEKGVVCSFSALAKLT
jgi:hypothetical protein